MSMSNSLFRIMLVALTLASILVAKPVWAMTDMVLSSWLPPRHPIVEKVIKPWVKNVATVTEGRVKIRVLSKPLGPPPAHFDLAKNGVADITYGLHSFTKDDRFLRSRVGQFSFLGNSAVSVSKAYWKVYSGQLDAEKEHEGVKLLGLFVHGPGMFHNNKREIVTPEDFSGLKVRTPGGYIASLAKDLGITTQFMGPGQVYEKLSRGVIDGVTFPIEALKAFKLTSHLSHSMRVPGGLYNTSWFVVMNEQKWSTISQKDRIAIDSVSGLVLAELAGSVWDSADQKGADEVSKSEIKLYEASTPVLDRIREIAAKHEESWTKAVAASGHDGKAALEAMRRLSALAE